MNYNMKKSIYELYTILKSETKFSDRLLAVMAFIFAYATMCYADITVTSQFGLVFIDSLIDLKPFSFYANALSSGIAPEGAVYDIGAYVIFGIWSIPIWILNKLFGLSALSTVSLLWYKMLVLVALGGSIYYLYNISKIISCSNKIAAYSVLIYMLSATIFMPVFVVAQYDILALLFLLQGVYWYLKDDNRKFLIAFAIAMVIKPFPILLLLLMIVWKDKNILIIIKKLMQGCSLFVICKLLYMTNSEYRNSAGSFMKSHSNSLFEFGIDGGAGTISYYVLTLLIVYAYAFLQKKGSTKKLIILMFVIWAAFCSFVDIYPYWIIYIAPFMVMVVCVICYDNNNLLIFDLVANVCMIVALIINYSWVYGGSSTYNYLVLKNMCNVDSSAGGVTIGGILMHLKLDNLLPAINACCFGSLLIIGFVAWRHAELDSKEYVLNPWHYRLRIVLMYIWIIATLATLLLTNMGY